MKTKSLIFLLALMLFRVHTQAQSSTWNFHTMLSYDDPANLSLISGADIVNARNNFHQHFGIERVFGVHKNLGIIVGGNAGFLRSYFWYQTIDGFSTGLEFREIKYYGAHSGISLSHHFNKYFYCQINIRAGVFAVTPSSLNPPEITPPETNDDLSPLVYRRLPFSVNEENEKHFFIKPDITLGFKVPESPISITMGIARLFSPKVLIEGEIEIRQYLLDQEFVSHYSFNDGLNAIGFTFGLNYHLN